VYSERSGSPWGSGTLRRLRPYQVEVARAVLDSARRGRGLTLSVEMARQGGKNELSAQLELLLLVLHMAGGGNLVKCAPTFQPQLEVSRRRLAEYLDGAGFRGLWRRERDYIVRLGRAQVLFLSGHPAARVVGNTAHILLEVDEAQDMDKEKFSRDFRPMASAHNATTVLYGTAWDGASLLEEVKQANLAREAADGLKRHFRYDWETVARYNPAYGEYVTAERARLGATHPLFLTQYCLVPLRGGSSLFTGEQLGRLQGGHESCSGPAPGRVYVAGVDVGGETAADGEGAGPDATVLTIAEVEMGELAGAPRARLRIVQHYLWQGRRHAEACAEMARLLKEVWHCRAVAVDATGLGQPVASLLRDALGSRVTPVVFTARGKSELGFRLLAAVNTDRLKMYRGDGSAEAQQFWGEMAAAEGRYPSGGRMDFGAPPGRGRDDFLMSLALLVAAGESYAPRTARGSCPVIPAGNLT